MPSRTPPPKVDSHRTRGRDERRLRIIGGHWRGRRFRFPPLALRPTPDRVRETLFNWLQARIAGAHCLDLYAGSGALGLEALSRGAASVTFVEQRRAAATALQALLAEWQATGWSVACSDARAFLGGGRGERDRTGRGTAPQRRRFDVVFLDPPFGSGELTAATAALAQGWLAEDARIYVEHAREEPLPPLPPLPPQWHELKAGSAGEVRYHLFAPTGGIPA